jgi:hypothetical protein
MASNTQSGRVPAISVGPNKGVPEANVQAVGPTSLFTEIRLRQIACRFTNLTVQYAEVCDQQPAIGCASGDRSLKTARFLALRLFQ